MSDTPAAGTSGILTTPAGKPSAPRNFNIIRKVSADGEKLEVTLDWEAPSDTGGSPGAVVAITSYEYINDGITTWIETSSATSQLIENLDPNRRCTFNPDYS